MQTVSDMAHPLFQLSGLPVSVEYEIAEPRLVEGGQDLLDGVAQLSDKRRGEEQVLQFLRHEHSWVLVGVPVRTQLLT